MKKLDNDFKSALLKELTNFASKDNQGNAIILEDDEDYDDTLLESFEDELFKTDDDFALNVSPASQDEVEVEEDFDFIPLTAGINVELLKQGPDSMFISATPVEEEKTATSFEEKINHDLVDKASSVTFVDAVIPQKDTKATSTTIISRATTINGIIQTRENLIVEGIVNGDIISQGKVYITGSVAGTVTGYEVTVSSEELAGSIYCETKTVIHGFTKLKGSIDTDSATISGTIEGNVTARGRLELLGNAVVYGDVEAADISAEDGAVIYGIVAIT